MVLYMLIGASVFMLLERDREIEDRNAYFHHLRAFLDDNPTVNRTDLERLLAYHAEVSAAGLLNDKRQRWDFSGSFYFVGTVVSTIGFGMTTPRTTEGKALLIVYGLFGCAGAFLFFNLFLERIITFLAFILRTIHMVELRRKGLLDGNGRRNSQSSTDDDDNLDNWKPSVYWVMLILFLGAVVIACCASAMYQPNEQWTYFETVYFCFVAFATIGFGDYVVSQRASVEYDNVHWYRFGNFVFLVVGCCFIYSLFNVTSIVIKQFLNWIIKKLECRCCYRPKPRPRRNAITPGHIQKARNGAAAPDLTDVDSNYDSEGSRRGSSEMISMRDFLQANKISLAMMQKQLYETAQRGAFRQSDGGGFQGGVGPLAILNRKLGQEDV